jgi:NMD protein affecting ribosome stability and mRNA decay
MCRKVTELMTDDMEGKLQGLKKVELDFHMLLCPFCSRYKKQLETTIATVRETQKAEASADARTAAISAFRARKKTM